MVSCASYAVEAVAAASIAAFMHIRMDGDEMINQEQKAIYGIILNGAMRPTLLLVGLIASQKLFAVMATYLNRTFASAMLSSQGNSLIGIVGIIVMLAILMYMHYQLAIRSLRMITEVPKMVSQILGVQDGDRGENESHSEVFGAVSRSTRSAGAGLAARAMDSKKKTEDTGAATTPPAAPSATPAAESVSKVPEPSKGNNSDT